MGHLAGGKWLQDSTTDDDGAYRRKPTQFHNWITRDGGPGPSGAGGFRAESGRYHLYVSYACPWAHRALIFRKLKGLTDHISVSVVHPDMLADGWSFDTDDDGATGDTLMGKAFLREVYLAADPKATTRVTVPILWDKARGTIVSNESAEIIRMFDQAFADIADGPEFWPEDLRAAIEPVNDRIYHTINNGVYKAGFARSQAAYDQAVSELFASLDWLEDRLSQSRYLLGDRITEADWRLATTLFRFDPVYHGHFKCSRNRLFDMPNLWGYTRELYQWPGVAETVNFNHIRRHYYYSHETVNPTRIVPVPPVINWDAPHGRG